MGEVDSGAIEREAARMVASPLTGVWIETVMLDRGEIEVGQNLHDLDDEILSWSSRAQASKANRGSIDIGMPNVRSEDRDGSGIDAPEVVGGKEEANVEAMVFGDLLPGRTNESLAPDLEEPGVGCGLVNAEESGIQAAEFFQRGGLLGDE